VVLLGAPARALEEARDRCRLDARSPEHRPLRHDLRLDDPVGDKARFGGGGVERERCGGEANLESRLEVGEHRLWGRVGECFDAGPEAGLLAGGDDVVVVGGGELAREQEQRLVREACERDGVGAREAVALADEQRERLLAQRLAAHSPHRLGVQGKADVELAREDAAGDLCAEELAGDDGQVRAVVCDGGEDRAERLEAGHRRVAEPDRSGDARPGEARTLGGALERGERERCLLEERPPGGGELDMAAGADEQVGAQGPLELVDLVAQRWLGDVEACGGPAEVELLRNGQEVAEQARLEIDSRRLTLASITGLGRLRRPGLAS